MNENIKKFKKVIVDGNAATIEAFLKEYQRDDVANWILNDKGESALHYLANEEICENTPNRENLVHLLLENGADIHLKDKFGATPMSEACFSLCASVVQLFIARGADVKEVNDRGYTLLESPVLQGETEIVDMLLDAGAGSVINTISKKGDALIHRVLDTEDNDILENVIHAGADINIGDKDGRTVLHLNVLHRKDEVVNKILLAHRADYLIADKNGKTALQYAAKESFYPLINGIINAKLSEYRVASTEEKNSILNDCIEKFKILLLENPLFFKPKVLSQPVTPLPKVINYLSGRWDNIQQELQVRKSAALLSAGVNGLFKFPTQENLSEIPLPNTPEEGNDKAFKPA